MKKILLRSIAVLVLVLSLAPAILPQKVVVERKAEVGADASLTFRGTSV